MDRECVPLGMVGGFERLQRKDVAACYVNIVTIQANGDGGRYVTAS
jgi:hypothetical protein